MKLILITLLICLVVGDCVLSYTLIEGTDTYEVNVANPQFCSGNVTIPSNHPDNNKLIVRIASNAFKGSTITNISIPNTIIEIGNYTFYGCKTLQEINLPNSLKIIGNQAFIECKGLKNVIIPDSVISIGSYAFHSCYGLKSITLSKELTLITRNCFADTNIVSIDIPPKVEIIEEFAFAGCSAMTNVTFHSSPIIGKNAFMTDRYVTVINMFGPNDLDQTSCDNIYFENKKKAIIYVTPLYNSTLFCNRSIVIINETIDYLCSEENQNKCKEYFTIIASEDPYRNNIDTCFTIGNVQKKFVKDENLNYYLKDCSNTGDSIRYYPFFNNIDEIYKVKYSTNINNIAELFKIITSYCSVDKKKFILNQFGVSQHQYSDELCSTNDQIISVYANGDLINEEIAIISPIKLSFKYMGTSSMYRLIPTIKPIMGESNLYIYEIFSITNGKMYQYNGNKQYNFVESITPFTPSDSLIILAQGNECSLTSECKKNETLPQYTFTTACVNYKAFRTIGNQLQLVEYADKNCFDNSIVTVHTPSYDGIILINNNKYFIEVTKKDESAEIIYGVYSDSYFKSMTNICIQTSNSSSKKYVYGFFGIGGSKHIYNVLYSSSNKCEGSFIYETIERYQKEIPIITTKGKIGYSFDTDLKCTLEGIENGFLTKYFNIEKCVFGNSKYLIVKDKLIEYIYSDCLNDKGKTEVKKYILNKCNAFNEFDNEYVGFIVNFNCETKFFDGCNSCDSLQCLSCENDLFLKEDQCQNCSQMYGNDCLKCDIQNCLSCKTKKLVNGKCIVEDGNSENLVDDDRNGLLTRIILISIFIIGVLVILVCIVFIVMKVMNKNKSKFHTFNKLN